MRAVGVTGGQTLYREKTPVTGLRGLRTRLLQRGALPQFSGLSTLHTERQESLVRSDLYSALSLHVA